MGQNGGAAIRRFGQLPRAVNGVPGHTGTDVLRWLRPQRPGWPTPSTSPATGRTNGSSRSTGACARKPELEEVGRLPLPRLGPGQLWDAAAARLAEDGSFPNSTRVIKLGFDGETWTVYLDTGETVRTDAVFPPCRFRQLVDALDPTAGPSATIGRRAAPPVADHGRRRPADAPGCALQLGVHPQQTAGGADPELHPVVGRSPQGLEGTFWARSTTPPGDELCRRRRRRAEKALLTRPSHAGHRRVRHRSDDGRAPACRSPTDLRRRPGTAASPMS